MEKAEILEKIKEAEQRMEEMIREAEEEKKKKILTAKEEARKLIEKAEEEAKKIKEEIISKSRADIDLEKTKIKERRTAEINSIVKKGESKINEVAEFLYNEFVRAIEHA
uniref:ATP synthase archaeal subunit H n=1 Tax=Geoglobus ahangari TaxID=113653 RepID=A0A7C4S5V3_9EURY